jgi:predicted DsbA family dithiol-disulfide isomerase
VLRSPHGHALDTFRALHEHKDSLVAFCGVSVLIDVATQAGLDLVRAREILESGLYADEVRERERFYGQQGIHAVPSVIVNDKYLIQGGQPVEVFEQALRKIAVE